jgi:hypothetical protein
MQAMAAEPAPLQTSLVSLMSRSGQVERIDQPGHGDDRGAMLVVMEHRNVHLFAQAAFDDEAVRRLDVLKVDAAKGRPEIFDRIDELFDIVGVDSPDRWNPRRQSA